METVVVGATRPVAGALVLVVVVAVAALSVTPLGSEWQLWARVAEGLS